MAILHIRDKNRKLVEVPNGSLDFSEGRILVCLPGDYVSSFGMKMEEDPERMSFVYGYGELKNNFQKHANGMLKITERMLGGKDKLDEKDKLMLAAYPYDLLDNKNLESRLEYNQKNPHGYYADYAETFTTNIVGLIAKDPKLKDKVKLHKNGYMSYERKKLYGEKLDAETLDKNLSRLTFFGYSHGSVFSGEICNCLKVLMRDVGYEEDEIKRALKNVTTIAVASVAQVTTPEANYFTTVHFQAKNDAAAEGNFPGFEEKHKDTRPIELYLHDPKTLQVVCENKSPIVYFKGASETALGKEIDPNFHTLRQYSAYKYKAENTIPVMIENATRNAFYRDKPFKDIYSLLSRNAEKPDIKEGYYPRAEIKENSALNDRVLVKYTRRVFNHYIKDLVDEARGEGAFQQR